MMAASQSHSFELGAPIDPAVAQLFSDRVRVKIYFTFFTFSQRNVLADFKTASVT
jgi:hypothetical protein